MATTQTIKLVQAIPLKRSDVPGVIPHKTELIAGEAAVNTHDGKMFIKKDNDEVIEVGKVPDMRKYVESVNEPVGAHTAMIIKNLIGISQADYDALATKEPTTLYVIV